MLGRQHDACALERRFPVADFRIGHNVLAKLDPFGKALRSVTCTILHAENILRGSWPLGKAAHYAHCDGQFVAMIDDIGAMVNIPGSVHDNDQIWQINSIAPPPLNTMVEVTLKLEGLRQ
jgi:hypothetical protein